jgi:hypothetical protein
MKKPQFLVEVLVVVSHGLQISDIGGFVTLFF